jgi:hypothetical protein
MKIAPSEAYGLGIRHAELDERGHLLQFASPRELVGCSPDQLSNDSDITVPIFG